MEKSQQIIQKTAIIHSKSTLIDHKCSTFIKGKKLIIQFDTLPYLKKSSEVSKISIFYYQRFSINKKLLFF